MFGACDIHYYVRHLLSARNREKIQKQQPDQRLPYDVFLYVVTLLYQHNFYVSTQQGTQATTRSLPASQRLGCS